MITNARVKKFWEEAACGEKLLLKSESLEGFNDQSRRRYELEPYIKNFAEFKNSRGLKVLEIGLGIGADHEEFAKAGAILYGIDLTERAIALTMKRLSLKNLQSNLEVGDAENLPYQDNYFDIVYSWGVIHHSNDTQKSANEILRVLKPGGEFKIMIYHKWSLVGLMLWVRYAFLTGKLFIGLDKIYYKHLESYGTKAYSRNAGGALFAKAKKVNSKIQLSHGDLLESEAGQRHRGLLLSFAKIIWPRKLLKIVARNFGLFLLIYGTK